MRTRLASWWFRLGQSLWFLPAVLTIAAVGLALLTVAIDQRLLLDRRAGVPWLFSGGAEGARGVLEAIAGTTITVTGLVFSITVVALQLAASQLSPRVLHTFMSDRLNQAVMGCFIGTFTYSLLVLRVVYSPTEGGRGFVPSLSVTVAISLALVSVGLLIVFIHHAADAMRASVVIDRAAAATRTLVDHHCPADSDDDAPAPAVHPPNGHPVVAVIAADSGYLQVIDADALVKLADRRDVVIRAEPLIGEFILAGVPLATAWPAANVDDETSAAIRAAFGLGSERTLQADVALGLKQLSDIAVKALSPGINDPTTATICIDRLSEVVVILGRCRRLSTVHRGAGDGIRLILPQPSFASLVDVAFAGIRQYGTANPIVAAHLVTALGRIAQLVPRAHRPVIAHQAALTCEGVRQESAVPADKERVERAAAWIAAGPGSVSDIRVPSIPSRQG